MSVQNKKLNKWGFGWYLYILPALLFYVLFMAWPLLDSIRLSLYTGTTGFRTFVGLENYKHLFTEARYSERYWGAFSHTVIFFIFHMVIQNWLGVFFAVQLTKKGMQARQIYQTIIFLPTTLAVVITGYLWKLLLNPLWCGPLLQSLGLDFLIRPWLGDAKTALICVSLVSCWQWIGIPVMMFVAALRGIDESYIEAADIEGASSTQIFWRIKLPLISFAIGMIAILTFVNNFNAFDIVFSMETSNGAPNYATDLLGTLFYRVGIAGQHPIGIPDPGMGAAIATITFFVLCIGVIPTLRATQKGN